MKLVSRTRAAFCAVVITLSGIPPAGGQVIPRDRVFVSAWRNAGYPADDASPGRLVNVRDFGAAGDGLADDQPAVAAALGSLAGEPGQVFFPSGAYLIRSPVTVPSGVVLRGQGARETSLVFDFVENAIRVIGTATGNWIPLTVPASVHQGTITVPDGGIFSAGDYAMLRQDADPAWKITDDWGRRAAGQIVRVTAVNGHDLSLENPLRHDYPAGRHPEIRRLAPNRGGGVENLRVERLLAGENRGRNNRATIEFSYAAGGRVRGVHSVNAFGSHVEINYSTGVEVSGCFFDGAHEHDDGGSGYGVKVQFTSGECLVENNIFRRLRHAMLLQAGANGNVFGYNYSFEAKSDSHPGWAGDVSLHGNYPYANLFEGNIVEHIWLDNSHDGINGPRNTFFRNRAEKCGFNMTDPAADGQNVVGNEFFQGGLLALFAAGNGYRLQGNGHFAHGNLTRAAGRQPPETGNLPDYSYYLDDNPLARPAAPAWWTIADPLPVIGPPHDLAAVKNNPARARWLSGGEPTVTAPDPGPAR